MTVQLTGECVVKRIDFGDSFDVRMAWSADTGSGKVEAVIEEPIEGILRHVETKPSGKTPDDNYNVQILNRDGRDILNEKATARSQSDTELVTLYESTNVEAYDKVSGGPHRLLVTSAGTGAGVRAGIVTLRVDKALPVGVVEESTRPLRLGPPANINDV